MRIARNGIFSAAVGFGLVLSAGLKSGLAGSHTSNEFTEAQMQLEACVRDYSRPVALVIESISEGAELIILSQEMCLEEFIELSAQYSIYWNMERENINDDYEEAKEMIMKTTQHQLYLEKAKLFHEGVRK